MSKHVYFRRQSYDAQKLTQLVNQGHRQEVATQDIVTIAAAPAFTVPVAVMVEGKFHLLTGSIDAKQPKHVLHVLSKPVLKKALVEETYTERRREQSSHRDQMAGMGAMSYRMNRN